LTSLAFLFSLSFFLLYLFFYLFIFLGFVFLLIVVLVIAVFIGRSSSLRSRKRDSQFLKFDRSFQRSGKFPKHKE